MNSKTLVLIVCFALFATIFAESHNRQRGGYDFRGNQRGDSKANITKNFPLFTDQIRALINRTRNRTLFRSKNRTDRRQRNQRGDRRRREVSLAETSSNFSSFFARERELVKNFISNKTDQFNNSRFARKVRNFFEGNHCNKSKAAVRELVQKVRDVKQRLRTAINNQTLHNELRNKLRLIKENIEGTIRNATRKFIRLQEEVPAQAPTPAEAPSKGGRGQRRQNRRGDRKEGSERQGGRKGKFDANRLRFGRQNRGKKPTQETQLEETSTENKKEESGKNIREAIDNKRRQIRERVKSFVNRSSNGFGRRNRTNSRQFRRSRNN